MLYNPFVIGMRYHWPFLSCLMNSPNKPSVKLINLVHHTSNGEIRPGRANEYLNLISDVCTTVNAYYERAETNSSNIDLNVVTEIGVRAVGNNGSCINIGVDLDTCTPYVNDVMLNTTSFLYEGIRLRWNVNRSRVRISVPNCADTMLVMWVFCSRGDVEDPVTWAYYNIRFIRFVVMRGLAKPK